MTLGGAIFFLPQPNGFPMTSHGFPSSSRTESTKYYVKEPHGKRPAPQPDLFDSAPRAKRRFERVNSMLGDFSISNDTPFHIESSSDDDMSDDISDPSSPAIVEEPDDPAPSRIQLDDRLKGFLERAKQNQDLLPTSLNVIRGDEMVVWKPMRSLNPFDDPSMKGRITEVSSDEDDEGDRQSPDCAEVSTPSHSDEEMTVDSDLPEAPVIQELSDEDGRCSSAFSSDGSLDMEY